MSTRSNAAFNVVVEYCVIMRTKNHISGAIDDPIVRVCGTIIECLIYCFVRAFGAGGLLGSNGTKADK